jgi:2-oxoglutarate ferredoxin oxidoreductase subunit gamma
MAFNEPSVERFAPELLPGGQLFVNSTLIKTLPDRADIEVVQVPATEAAGELGRQQVANMVMLGAFLAKTGVLNPESVLLSLADHGMKEDLININRRALEAGQKLISAT